MRVRILEYRLSANATLQIDAGVCSPHAQMVPLNSNAARQLLHKFCNEGLPPDAFEELLNLCDGVFSELKVLLQDLCQLPE